MKRKFTFLLAALLLMSGLAWAQTGTTITWTASEQGYDNGQSLDGVSIELNDYVTIQFDKNDGNNAPAYYNTGSAARMYPKNSLTVTPASGYQITEMTLTFSSTGNTGTLGASVGSYSLSSVTGTWSGSSTAAVVLTNNATSGHARLQELTVTYTDGSTPVPTTYTVTYDCNGGTSGCPENVTNIEPGTQIQLADAPSRDNYDFDGWSDGANIYGENEDYTVNGNVTFTARWTEQSSGDVQWILTNLADLTENDVFVIVGNNGSTYAMSNDKGTSGAPITVAVTVENDAITGTVAANIQWTVSGNATNGYTFYPNGSTTTWLYCNTNANSGSNNNIRVGTGDRKVFELNSNNYLITKDDNTVRYLSIYDNADWRGYINTNLCPTMSFYKKVTGGVVPPSITAENILIEYAATEGSITYTINHGVEGGILTAATESDWLTLGEVGTTVPFTCPANEASSARTATVTLTYTYDDNETVSKDVTVTQAAAPVIYTTIPALFEAATNAGNTATDVTVTFGNWVVTGANNSSHSFVSDGTNGFMIYGSNQGFSAGDVLSGTVECKVQLYNGAIEITQLTSTTAGLTVTTGGTVTVANIAMADLAGINTGDLVSYQNVTCEARVEGDYTNYYLSDGTTEIQAYKTLLNNYADYLEGGKTYNITGVFVLNNTTKRINPRSAADIEEVAAPVVASITVDPATVNATAAETEGTITVTYTNIDFTNAPEIVFYSDAEGTTQVAASYYEDWFQAEINSDNNVDYLIGANDGEARTAYFKVYGLDNYVQDVYSNLVTITQAAYEAPATTGTIVFGTNGTKINAAEVTGTDSFGNAWTITTVGTTSFTQNAAYSQVGSSNSPAESITFTTTLPQEATITAFSAKFGGFNGTAGDVSLNVGETEVGSGSLNGTADVVVENTQTATGTVLTVTVTNIAKGVKCYYISYSISLGTDPIITVPISVNLASDATEGEFTYSIINPVAGVTLSATSTDEWISNIAVTADNVTFTTTANTETTERQGTITVSYEGAEDKTVTVIQAAYVAPVPTTTYTLATSIESGRHYIIVAMDGDEAYAMGGQNNNNRAAVSITVEDGVAQVSSDDVYEFVINTVGFTDEIDPYFEPRSGWSPAAYPGYWKYTIYDAAQPGYLYAASSSNNYLKTETHLDANDNGVWAIEIYDENETQYAAHIAAFGDNTRKVMRYNSSNHIFSCYGTGNNMKSICLYVKDEDLPQYDFYKDVKGYGTSEGGYALMATPTTENANPNLVGMITDDGTDPDNFTYDLYGFDFTQDQEWRNYRSNAFNMNNGQGYLYANKNNVTLHFQGASYTSYKTVNLQFGNTNNHWNGWNLIGNPRSDVSWVGTSNFYVMNEAGTELELSNRSYVNPMEGIFVKATAANQSIYFADFWYYEEEWLDEILNIKVNGNNSSGDFARIRFGEGRNLEKFMLNQNHTKLYFTQGNKDYAVVRSANEGEMLVNFKAETNGTYTISVNAENVDMNYLHLIDNVTGADVDLLATPSYSFEANTNDYANRFRLVFKANASVSENADAESFAFFNGSTWTVSNLGEATLQVVDMTGRVLSSETINGNAEISIKQEPGVYMLRLINGDNVKTQKVVVK